MQTTMVNGKEYAYDIDLGKGNSVEVRETWEGPTPAYPKGSYQMLIGGKVEAATGRFAVLDKTGWISEFADWPKDFSPKPETEKL